jgi:hypothetical protein
MGNGAKLYAFVTSELRGVWGQLHVPVALPLGKIPHSPLDKRLDGPHSVDVVARRKPLTAQPAATHFTELQ